MELPRVAAACLAIAVAASGVHADDASLATDRARARSLLETGESNDAAALYSDLLAAAPDDAELLTGRIHALLGADRWAEALAEARAAGERSADDPRIRTLLAEALFRAGELDEVGEVLEGVEALEDAPGRALLTLARLEDARGRGAVAAELARRAVESAPGDREILFRAAGVAGTRGEAIEWLEAFLDRGDGEPASRIESAEGSVRLFRALGDTRIWTSRTRPERVEIPLTPLWIEQTGQIVGYTIRVRLGERNRAVRLLLDSGSPGLFVIDRLARKRGFEPLAEITVFGGGGPGRHEARRGFFPRIGIGDLEFEQVLASVSRQEIDPLGRFHGLIGLSAFQGYRITVDLKRKKLLLELGEAGVEGQPYFSVGGQMLVTAEASGDRSGLFLFDTGATHTLVSRALVAGQTGVELAGTTDVPAFGGFRRDASILAGFEVRLQGLSTGVTGLRAVDLSVRSAVSGIEISGFLGLDLLRGKRIHVDTIARTVLVEDPAGGGAR